MPARGDREITLLNLAAQDSGLPFNADNYRGADWKERFEGYTAEMMYDYLAGHALAAEPGAQFQYSNIGVALLGHALERRAGKDLDTLLAERICRPLGMESTRIRLTPELKARLAPGHDEHGKPTPSWELTVIAGTGGMRSTVNDLLKYVSAHLGLTRSPLTPLMERSHAIRHRGDAEFGNTAMPWVDDCIIQPPGAQILGHGGGTSGYSAFVGFDLKRRRGFVVLANQAGKFSSRSLGWRLIQGAPLAGQQLATISPIREHVGIGAALTLDEATETVRITKVLDDSPASRAHVPLGWILESINDVPIAGKTPQECVALIRGARGTTVRLQLSDPKDRQTRTVEVTRGTFRTGEG
jgi:CubicO group peptidase (beta-lactamase class C family)